MSAFTGLHKGVGAIDQRCFLCEPELPRTTVVNSPNVTTALTQQPQAGDPQRFDAMRSVLDGPNVSHHSVTFDNRADLIRAVLTRPKGRGKYPAVVVVPGDFGLGDYTRVTVAQLAQRGFVGLGLDTFSRASTITDLAAARRLYFDVMTDAMTLQDVQAAIHYLKRQPFVKAGGVGVLGFCLGGRYALLIGALSRDVAAVVAYYGPLVLLHGEPDVHLARPLKIPNHEMSPADFVDWINVPVQGHYAARDETIPLVDVQGFERALRQQGVPAELFVYDTESHFHSFHEPYYNEEAAKLSWYRTIGFFSQHLE